MNILNCAHPLTQKQLEQIQQIVGQPIQAVLDVRIQFELEHAFAPQVVEMLEPLGIAPDRWQTEVWLIVLPSLNYIAAALLAELHGRMGHFPSIVRLRPVPNALVTEYEVGEILNLERIRQEARTRR